MKKYIIIVIIICSGCCDDFYIGPVDVTILKDGRALSSQNVFPSFYYTSDEGTETYLDYIGADSSTYLINQSTQLRQISFEPKEILIRYSGLSDVDMLEILLDYECNTIGSCGCKAIVLKYMKCNSVLLPDFTVIK